jgi:polyphosphate kinase
MAAGLWAGMSGAAVSHPHVFVDTGIEILFDDQARATALRITWSYDDLFSMMIVEDRNMDADFDGVLTADETLAIQGFDMQWEPEFAGDTHVLVGDAPQALSGPSDWTTTYADGRLTSTHVRRFDSPIVPGDAPLVVQVYDPGFYTAYAITMETTLTGRTDCTAQTYEPDREAADEILQAAIAEQAGSTDIEGAFPAIGAAYAEEVRITCAAPS